jgi:hypothetical protein
MLKSANHFGIKLCTGTFVEHNAFAVTDFINNYNQ